MNHKKHIFFDLDHTIWDFDRNAEETLHELYLKYELQAKGLAEFQRFISRYKENNQLLWSQYHLGQISKEFLRAQRFHRTFTELGLDPQLVPHSFEEEFVKISPTKTNLFDNSLEVLSYLQQKYHLHIISNGFKETTLTKMEVSALNPFFKNVIISEDVGVNKPDKAIFEYALNLAQAHISESIMIGDSLEADIYGAQNYGMDAIFFNPESKQKPDDVKNQIFNLKELLNLF